MVTIRRSTYAPDHCQLQRARRRFNWAVPRTAMPATNPQSDPGHQAPSAVTSTLRCRGYAAARLGRRLLTAGRALKLLSRPVLDRPLSHGGAFAVPIRVFVTRRRAVPRSRSGCRGSCVYANPSHRTRSDALHGRASRAMRGSPQRKRHGGDRGRPLPRSAGSCPSYEGRECRGSRSESASGGCCPQVDEAIRRF